MLQNFFKQGGPGIKLKPEFDKIYKSLNLPKSVLDELELILVRSFSFNDLLLFKKK